LAIVVATAHRPSVPRDAFAVEVNHHVAERIAKVSGVGAEQPLIEGFTGLRWDYWFGMGSKKAFYCHFDNRTAKSVEPVFADSRAPPWRTSASRLTL
jgi:hypothetical protein